VYRSSDRRTETYAGRVKALLVNHNRINVREKVEETDGRTPDEADAVPLSAVDSATVTTGLQ